jgi:putative AdoMet-dependent methyltransferase
MDDNSSQQQFDRWAADYDADVDASSGAAVFPFDGYERVLDRVVELAEIAPGMVVLELGPGTGNLTARLLAAGAAVWAVDFSAEMLARARVKAPAAVFAQAGLMDDYPPEFHRPFSRIVSTYTFHELPLADKLTLLRRLAGDHLHPGGHIVIGDIGFPDATARDAVKQRMGEWWEDEYYWLADEAVVALKDVGFTIHYEQLSSCGVVISLEPESI